MIHNKPALTIITVVYNDVNNIENTIKSIINQTYWEYIEYIIIDGGSTDGTVEIIKKYDNVISCWISEKDGGIYDAMNKGTLLAKSNWVNFMNSGDSFFSKNTIRLIIDHLSDENDIVYGNTNTLFNFGNAIIKAKEYDFLKYNMPFCHQSSFIKKNLLITTPYDLSYKYVADYNFFYTCYHNKNRYKQVDITIANFEAITGISSSNKIEVFKEILRVQNGQNSFFWQAKFQLSLLKYLILEYIKKYFPNLVNSLRKFSLSIKD